MTLKHPTMAEQTVDLFEQSSKTVSLAFLAMRAGAERTRHPDGRSEYTFDDDTTLMTKGRGRNYKYWTELP